MRISTYGIESLTLSLLLKSGTGGTDSSRWKDGRGTRRGRDEDDPNRRPAMKLNVQEILKALLLLVDNWETVTKNNQVRSSLTLKVANNRLLSPLGLVTLPRIPVVAKTRLSSFRRRTWGTRITRRPPLMDSDLLQIAGSCSTTPNRHQRPSSLLQRDH